MGLQSGIEIKRLKLKSQLSMYYRNKWESLERS